MIIDDFLNVATSSEDKNAFIYRVKNKLCYKTYHDVKVDMFKMINYLKQCDIKEEVLMFMMPSYQFYITLLSCLYLKITIVVIDSFKDQKKFVKMLSKTNCKAMFVDNLTSKLSHLYFPVRHLKRINVSLFENYPETWSEMKDLDKKVLITFTSGTTGDFKRIERSIRNLEKQFMLVKTALSLKDEKLVVLSLLPIYVLANLTLGVTSYLIFGSSTVKKIQKEEKYLLLGEVNAIAASVSKYLALRKPLPCITRAYTGGSLISLRDARKIKELLPNAYFTYVYGASEAVLISKTSLDEYIKALEKNEICIGDIVPGVSLKIAYLNDEVGSIMIKGEAVLTTNEYHDTGDLGYIKDNKVYLVGRVKTSNIDSKIYAYQIENEILNNYNEVKRVCYINCDKNHLFVEGKIKKTLLEQKYPHFVIHKMKKLPVDLRHNYKTDLNALLKLLK